MNPQVHNPLSSHDDFVYLGTMNAKARRHPLLAPATHPCPIIVANLDTTLFIWAHDLASKVAARKRRFHPLHRFHKVARTFRVGQYRRAQRGLGPVQARHAQIRRGAQRGEFGIGRELRCEVWG